MEVKIGVQNAAREIVFESSQSPADVEAALQAALAEGGLLRLVDDKGRIVVVPTAGLAYIEIGVPESRRVGFGGG